MGGWVGGGWVGGQYKTKLRLISTQVKVEVEVGLELGKSYYIKTIILLFSINS